MPRRTEPAMASPITEGTALAELVPVPPPARVPLDAAGKVVRGYSSEGRAAAPQGRGGGRGRGGAPSILPKKAGMNRFIWDLRYAGGPAGGGDPSEVGGGFAAGGPMVPPGTYKAKLTADGITKT